jgi:hypothetical protein
MEATSPEADSSSSVLRRVGVVLIIIGVLDIAWMIHVISSGDSYSSSLNIFAVIAGVLLYRQSLRTARLVSLVAGFFFSASIGVLLALPLIFPSTLIRTYLRVTPLGSLLGWGVFAIAFLALLWWVRRSLTSSSVQRMMRSGGLADTKFWHRPNAGFLFGAGLAALLALTYPLMRQGASADEAIKRIRADKGPGYDYFVSGLSTSWSGGAGTHVYATVLVYTDSTIEIVSVEWRE